jgi:hypothetical protein
MSRIEGIADEISRYAARCAKALEQIAKALEPKPEARIEAAPHTHAPKPDSCFRCGKLLALCVECPECGAYVDVPCTIANGVHQARIAVAAKRFPS